MVKPNTFERPILKAVICVFSKLEMATMPRPQPFLRTDKGKAIADWLDKVPDDVSDAPDNLFSMPWREQLPWLKPAAAKALHDTMLAEEWEWPGKTHGLRVGANRATTVKGMTWNPLLFRWEGNEEALAAFM